MQARLTALLATTALIAAAPVLAHAADAAPAADTSTNVGEVVVTASKRAELLKNVPAAVTAVTSKDLTDKGILTARDLQGFVPGLQIASALGSGSYTIRGLTSGQDTSPTVGMQIDGAPIGPVSNNASSASVQPEIDPSLMSRVEVLRGPQGTLYGASTLGGIVNYVTRQPNLDHFTGTAYAEASGTHEGDGSYILRGSVSGPLVKDKVALLLSGFDNHLGGFIDAPLREDNFNFHHSYGGSASLLVQVTPDLQVQLSDYYSKLNSRNDLVRYDPATNQPTAGDLVYDRFNLPNYDQWANALIGKVNWQLPYGTLSYVGSYQTGHVQYGLDYDTAPISQLILGVLPLFGGVTVPQPSNLGVFAEIGFHKTTQELRFSSPDEGRIRFIVGGFYTREGTSASTGIFAPDANGNPLAGPLGNLDTYLLLPNYQEISGFGDVTVNLTDRLDITGGVRVGHIKQDYRQLNFGSDVAALNTFFTVLGLPPTPADTGINRSEETVTTWLANARYHFSDNGMVYARFATGYRPGGPNDQVPGVPATFSADTTQDFDIGLKTSFWEGRGYIDIDAYYIKWDNMQVLGVFNGLGAETNVGSATSTGIEASGSLRPIDGLTLGGTLAYANGHLDEGNPFGIGAKGDSLPLNPRWSGSLTAEYTWPAGAVDAFVGGAVRFNTERNSTFEHNASLPNHVLPGYTLVDLKAGVRKDGWEAAAFVRNLGDERAQIGSYQLSDLYVTIQRPRTIGVSLSANF